MPPIDFETAVQNALKKANDDDSHTERDDPSVFHPSQLAMCPRQCYLSKLGLKDLTDAFGVFQPGTLIHDFLEEHLKAMHPHHFFEYPIRHEVSGLTIVGRTDCYDPQNHIVYDIKSRGGWYNFEPPKGKHLDQVTAYMAALGAEKAQIVYISKKDLSEVRPWPEWDDDTDQEYIEFDEGRFSRLLKQAHDIRTAIERRDVPTSPDEIPFEKCDCYACQKEALDLPGVDEEPLEQGDSADKQTTAESAD